MFKLSAAGVTPEHFVGYRETWYCGRKSMPEGIKIDEEKIMYATGWPKVDGLRIAERGHFHWHVFLYAAHSDAYLVGKSVVIVNELKNQDDVGLRSFPKFAVTLLSQTEEGLRETAKTLHLPLDDIVLKEAPFRV